MSGIVVNVLPKTTFDFSNIVTGQTNYIPVGIPIEVTQYPVVGMAVRLHSASIDGSNNVQVYLLEDGFLDGSAEAYPGESDQFVELTSFDTPPALHSLAAYFNSEYVSVNLRAQRLTGTNPIIVTISVDVYLVNATDVDVSIENGQVVVGAKSYISANELIGLSSLQLPPSGQSRSGKNGT